MIQNMKNILVECILFHNIKKWNFRGQSGWTPYTRSKPSQARAGCTLLAWLNIHHGCWNHAGKNNVKTTKKGLNRDPPPQTDVLVLDIPKEHLIPGSP